MNLLTDNASSNPSLDSSKGGFSDSEDEENGENGSSKGPTETFCWGPEEVKSWFTECGMEKWGPVMIGQQVDNGTALLELAYIAQHEPFESLDCILGSIWSSSSLGLRLQLCAALRGLSSSKN